MAHLLLPTIHHRLGLRGGERLGKCYANMNTYVHGLGTTSSPAHALKNVPIIETGSSSGCNTNYT